MSDKMQAALQVIGWRVWKDEHTEEGICLLSPNDGPGLIVLFDRGSHAQRMLYALAKAMLAAAPSPEPIDMILHCPACGMQHIDAPQDHPLNPWLNPSHRSHLCGCGHIWRPADVPTNGVEAVKTKGKEDSPRPEPLGGERVEIPADLDVRRILLDVVPGEEGEGIEVYAKSVEDVKRVLSELAEKVEEAAAPSRGPDMRAICEALGFDPTNHHNAAKCPYCRPSREPEPAPALPAKKIEPGSDTHLSLLGAPEHFNLCAGKDRADILAYGRRCYEAGLGAGEPCIKAKPLEWSRTYEDQWLDEHHGFSITHAGSWEEKPYHAAWGEGDTEEFATMEEAQAWCQSEIDHWIAKHAALAQADEARGEPAPAARSDAVREALSLQHVYTGACPDDLDPNARDPECAACRALVQLEFGTTSAQEAQTPLHEALTLLLSEVEALCEHPEPGCARCDAAKLVREWLAAASTQPGGGK